VGTISAMAQATETLDPTGVLQLLERWRRVASRRGIRGLMVACLSVPTSSAAWTPPVRCRRKPGRSPVTVWDGRRLAARSVGVFGRDGGRRARRGGLRLNRGIAAYAELMSLLEVARWPGDPIQLAAPGCEHTHPHVRWRCPWARDLPCSGSRPASRDPASALGWLTIKAAAGERTGSGCWTTSAPGTLRLLRRRRRSASSPVSRRP
jgi:hypothetical protein